VIDPLILSDCVPCDMDDLIEKDVNKQSFYFCFSVHRSAATGCEQIEKKIQQEPRQAIEKGRRWTVEHKNKT
jgi:hypothetical protein